MSLNQTVLNNLGLGHLKGVVKAAIYLDGYDKVPRVEVEMVPLGMPQSVERQLYTTELTLRPPKPPAFDLDAMCAAAMGRIQSHIDAAATEASHHIARSLVAARYACGAPIREQHLAAMGPLWNERWVSFETFYDTEPQFFPTEPIEEGAPA
jgi:hypothetical protein